MNSYIKVPDSNYRASMWIYKGSGVRFGGCYVRGRVRVSRGLCLKCVVFEKEVSFWMLYVGV